MRYKTKKTSRKQQHHRKHYGIMHYYGKGLKDAAVVVIEVLTREGKKIPGIQGYHSVEFHKQKLCFGQKLKGPKYV